MNPDLALLILKKVKLPTNFRAGIIISVLIFKGFDIDGRVKRAMHRQPA